MNRRNFLKVSAAGAVSLALQACGQSIRTFIATPTTGPIFSPPAASPTNMIELPTISPANGTVPLPPRGLGSNSNYFLYTDCNPITGVSVSIDITKEIVSDIGFSFQLNAWSPEGANCSWQQYGFKFRTAKQSPLEVYRFVDNFPSADYVKSQALDQGNLIRYNQLMLTLPGSSLPAGYRFTITLKYDANQNVNGAVYTVLDKAGKSTATDLALESLTLAKVTGETRPISTADLAPINSFMLVLVGPGDGEHATLSSGAGEFIFAADRPLKAASKDPQCTSVPNEITTETANSVYDTLPAGASQKIKQSFEVGTL